MTNREESLKNSFSLYRLRCGVTASHPGLQIRSLAGNERFHDVSAQLLTYETREGGGGEKDLEEEEEMSEYDRTMGIEGWMDGGKRAPRETKRDVQDLAKHFFQPRFKRYLPLLVTLICLYFCFLYCI
jgi:hypothetical protein